MSRLIFSAIITTLIYSVPVILVFGGTAFVMGTGDFSAWGEGGRLGALVGSVFGAWCWALPMEMSNKRREIIDELLSEMDDAA